MLRLQQRRMLLGSKLDLVYEDRLSDVISDELWTTKSAELGELRRVQPRWSVTRARSKRTRRRDSDFRTRAKCLSIVRSEKSARTGRLVKTVVSNSTFDRGGLSAT
jgi:hypothetical protein